MCDFWSSIQTRETEPTSLRAYGRRLLKALKDMFAIIHGRDQYDSEAEFHGALEGQGYEVCTRAMWRVPPAKEARNLANRFREHGREYIRFITTPGVAPTNNLAEQAIRFVVLDRQVSQGTRSAGGRRWCERIWTAIATCARHGTSVFRFPSQSIQAHFGELPGLSLLPAPS